MLTYMRTHTVTVTGILVQLRLRYRIAWNIYFYSSQPSQTWLPKLERYTWAQPRPACAGVWHGLLVRLHCRLLTCCWHWSWVKEARAGARQGQRV